MKPTNIDPNPDLAASITKAASQQTYYTIRFLADRELAVDAYRAYAYFRWVDDALDAESSSRAILGEAEKRVAFVNRQKSILEACYRGEFPRDVSLEEQMLVELVQHDTEKNSGLQVYLRDMMAVMSFDAGRRGRLVTQAELNEYTRHLAGAVTEAMHYFIGHCCYSPHNEARYLAVTAAHITHMLRDTIDDIRAGYYNIPREVLEANHISPEDVQSDAYRVWVRGRVQVARTYFKLGRVYLDQVENPRCRLAGLAYTARFEGVLDLIERDGFLLRAAYPERNGLGAIACALGSVFPPLIKRGGERVMPRGVPARQRPLREL
ncbi:MAG: squalene/phytoene synthase family protein [Anaerolineales bacterium]|nr:squalene/phytoene synthase family protein [Anaerolineales bacterium]